ncbi:hypothetical protein [Calidithermus roseus]|uniref:Lipoprotein n=1 Tax=Calidithermus roseus TaxID=1644118 RepID=A0A399F1K8_9DEIN|nr:hypothetical protein [Calidithermus roseus]RIH89576.1 hypothetical protein Mrose_00164 [Calidithermus roseus]
MKRFFLRGVGLGLLAVLSACSGAVSGPSASGGSVAILGWPAASGTLRFQSGTTVLTQSPVDSGGQLQYQLPTPDPALLTQQNLVPDTWRTKGNGCIVKTSYQYSPSTIKHLRVDLLPLDGSGKSLGSVILANQQPVLEPGQKYAYLDYFDQDTTMKGTIDCPSTFLGFWQDVTLNLDLEAKQGWNYVLAEYRVVKDKWIVNISSSTTLPEGIRWRLQQP